MSWALQRQHCAARGLCCVLKTPPELYGATSIIDRVVAVCCFAIKYINIHNKVDKNFEFMSHFPQLFGF